jgi:hypothetical protein
VSIAVYDPAGKIVRRFDALHRNAGLNRFVWDLHYPGPTVFPGMILRGGSTFGPTAVPGNYEIELTVDGQKQRKVLAIVKDARLSNVSDADLREQFTLASQVSDAFSRTNEMVIRIREMKKQIADRAAKNASLAALAAAVEQSLSEVESGLYQVRNRSPRDTLNYPIKLNNQFATLLGDIEMGDSRPTDQMYAIFRELSASLAGFAGKLSAIDQGGLAQLNDALRAARQEPVAVR